MLAAIGPPAKAFLPDLIKLLPNRTYFAPQVCRIIGNLGEDAKDAIPVLIETLTKNQSNDAQLAAAEALLKLDVRDKKTVAALAKAALARFAPPK